MKLLILTQKIDKNDSVLGFFHHWVEEFSKKFSLVTVICLEMGKYDLPKNTKVLSLGKEEGISDIKYLFRFYKYILSERKNYDIVFIHMNQEYVLLGGVIWKLLGKKINLWRNHLKGGLLTNLAVFLSDKVFCTSNKSYTKRFKKTHIMPVGIDTELFKPDSAIIKKPDSILFLGRIAPVKKVVEFIDWLNELHKQGRQFEVTIAGDYIPKDVSYYKIVLEKISEYGLANKINFVGAVTQNEALKLYQSHETYVNFTPSGSMDKTILEASACETNVIVRNEDLKILENKRGSDLRSFVVENHSIKSLMEKLKVVLI